jgi:RNA-directed DNA polymerase
MNNLPFPSRSYHILESWLNSGVLEDGIWKQTIAGVPQGGIISPLISNHVLNGLQDALFIGCSKTQKINLGTWRKRRSRIDEKEMGAGKYVKHWHSFRSIRTSRGFVRYADDFVIITTDFRDVDIIKQNLIGFLSPRGIEINWDKSDIFEWTANKKWNFLGFTFHKIQKAHRHGLIVSRTDLKENRNLIYPERGSLQQVKRNIKDLINKSRNLSAAELISKLNPIIRGWTYYYMLGNGTNFVYSLDHFIWTRLRVWLIKKYPTTSRRLLYKNFFGTQICKKEAEKIRKEYSTKGFSFLTDNSKFIDISPVRLKWHFRSKIESESHRSNIRW